MELANELEELQIDDFFVQLPHKLKADFGTVEFEMAKHHFPLELLKTYDKNEATVCLKKYKKWFS